MFQLASDSPVAPEARDAIMDFARLQGDRIDLSQIDANSALAGNNAFRFIGTGAFSGQAGELRLASNPRTG